MTAYRNFHFELMFLILPCLLWTTRCDGDELSQLNANAAMIDSVNPAGMAALRQKPASVDRSLDSLGELIKSKQAELQMTEREISVKSAQMQQHEQRLAKFIETMNSLRQTCYITLVIGTGLILIGLIQMLIRRRSAGLDTQSE